MDPTGAQGRVVGPSVLVEANAVTDLAEANRLVDHQRDKDPGQQAQGGQGRQHHTNSDQRDQNCCLDESLNGRVKARSA